MASGGLYTQRSIIQDGDGAIYPRAPGQSSFPSYDNMMKMLLKRHSLFFTGVLFEMCHGDDGTDRSLGQVPKKGGVARNRRIDAFFPHASLDAVSTCCDTTLRCSRFCLGLPMLRKLVLPLYFFFRATPYAPHGLLLSKVTPRWLPVA